MTSRDFAYWLQGFFELNDTTPPGGNPADYAPTLSPKQVDLVRRHLAMVFLHEIDPSAGSPAVQAELSETHAGVKPPPRIPSPTGVPGGGRMRC